MTVTPLLTVRNEAAVPVEVDIQPAGGVARSAMVAQKAEGDYSPASQAELPWMVTVTERGVTRWQRQLSGQDTWAVLDLRESTLSFQTHVKAPGSCG